MTQRRSGTVTIFDVAEDAGVSTATVSRVANGHPHIREDTRVRVLEAMERLGYVANLRARGLAGGKTNMIGLLVDDLESSYIAQVVRGVDGAVAERGHEMVVSTMHHRSERTTRSVGQLFNGLVDGLIVLLAAGFAPYMHEVETRGFPIVMIDYEPTPGVPVVKAANEMGTKAAVEHLLELGHRRIGFITGELDVASARERLDAYRRTLVANDIPVDETLIREGDFLIESGDRATEELLDLSEAPTAIVASSDTEAYGAIHAIRRRGLSIPRDISLVGFDDVPETSYLTPALTTVRQPMRDMGQIAAESLMDLISDPERIPTTVELPTELIVRGTTATPVA